MPPTDPHAAIVYEPTEVSGITMRLSARDVLLEAVKGRAIDIPNDTGYINLHHVFGRMQRDDKTLRKLQLVRRQIGETRWFVWVVPRGMGVPEVDLDEGYNPVRGRYKRYADDLEKSRYGEYPNKSEAIKARRAWQLYVSKEHRHGLRTLTERIGDSERHSVTIVRTT